MFMNYVHIRAKSESVCLCMLAKADIKYTERRGTYRKLGDILWSPDVRFTLGIFVKFTFRNFNKVQQNFTLPKLQILSY